MYFTKTGRINNRIIRQEDILEIAHYFEEISSEQGGKCSFSVDYRDRTSVQDSSSKVFENAAFKRKDLSHICFKYESAYSTNNIDLRLEETIVLPFDSSYYSIDSSDEAWLNATSAKLTELINGIPKRSLFRKAFSFPWVLITYVLTQVIFWKLMPLLGWSFGERPLLADGSPDLNAWFIPAGLFFLIRAGCFIVASLSICFLYPEQEFAFGISRYPLRLKARKAIGWILCTLIIPIILSFFG